MIARMIAPMLGAAAHARRTALATLLLLVTTACRPQSTPEGTPPAADAVGSRDSGAAAPRTDGPMADAGPVADGPVTVTRLRGEPYSFAYSSGFTEPARLVVEDSAAWRAAWTRLYARGGPLPPLPAVDFARQSVIVAAFGQRATGGFGILVEDAALARDTLRVTIRSIRPGPRCGVTAALSQPVDLAFVPRLARPVVFVERDSVSVCP